MHIQMHINMHELLIKQIPADQMLMWIGHQRSSAEDPKSETDVHQPLILEDNAQSQRDCLVGYLTFVAIKPYGAGPGHHYSFKKKIHLRAPWGTESHIPLSFTTYVIRLRVYMELLPRPG